MEEIIWNRYGKKCFRRQKQYRTDGKYLIMWMREGLLLRYYHHQKKIYVGVCVDTCATLGICAERNAIFNMITNGEQEIKKVLAIMPNGKTGVPCGACRELMVQLMPNSYQKIEILMDFEAEEVVTLGELTPKWWI